MQPPDNISAACPAWHSACAHMLIQAGTGSHHFAYARVSGVHRVHSHMARCLRGMHLVRRAGHKVMDRAACGGPTAHRQTNPSTLNKSLRFPQNALNSQETHLWITRAGTTQARYSMSLFWPWSLWPCACAVCVGLHLRVLAWMRATTILTGYPTSLFPCLLEACSMLLWSALGAKQHQCPALAPTCVIEVVCEYSASCSVDLVALVHGLPGLRV